MTNVNDARKQIDCIDQKIISLLGERARYVKIIGELKTNKSKIKDSRREKQVLRRIKQQAIENGLDPLVIEKIYKELFEYFVSYQKHLFKR